MERFPNPETPPQTPPPTENDPEVIKNNLERLQDLSSALFKVSIERDEHRWEPYFALNPKERPYLKELIPTPPALEQKPTAEDLSKAEKDVLGLYIEAAAQIVEYRPRQSGDAREDSESLQTLYQTLGIGEQLRNKMSHDKPKEVEEVVRKVLVASRRLPSDKVTPEALKRFENVIEQARNRIRRNQEFLRGYTGR